MANRKKSGGIARRAFLRGVGKALVALPLADFALVDGRIVEASEGEVPKRLFTLFYPNGIAPYHVSLSGALAPLQPFMDRGLANVIYPLASGAAREAEMNAYPTGFRTGNHGRGAVAAVSGTYPKDDNSTHGISIDQACANAINPPTPLKTFSLGMTRPVAALTNPASLSNQLQVMFSFDEQGNGTLPITNPMAAFVKLFGDDQSYQASQQEKGIQGSILDAVLERYKTVKGDAYGLGKASQQRLADHFEAVRELEKRVQTLAAQSCQRPNKPHDIGTPGDLDYSQWVDGFRAHSELLVHAITCDIVRFGSLCYGEAGSHQSLPGMSLSGHQAAHAGDAQWATYIKHYMTEFARFMTLLDQVKESNGKSALDNSIIYVTTEMGDQNGGNPQGAHLLDPMCVITVGTAGGSLPVKGVIAPNGRYINDALASCYRAITGVDAPFGIGKFNTDRFLFG